MEGVGHAEKQTELHHHHRILPKFIASFGVRHAFITQLSESRNAHPCLTSCDKPSRH